MKAFYLLAIFVLAVNAIPQEKSRLHGENGWYIPHKDGEWKWVDLQEAESLLSAESPMKGRLFRKSPVTYHLYTNSNPTEGQLIKDTQSSIDSSHFRAANPTVFIIHGWNAGYETDEIQEIRDAWLSRGDVNVIVVDWDGARSVNYVSPVLAVPKVGKKVSSMIEFLHKNYNMSLHTLVLVGHSLGAHVCGHAGKNMESGKIHTIVGLDPALPLFKYNEPNKRLSADDAFYVESIHTNGGQWGFLQPIGKAAFYPNGGKGQPGCKLDLTGTCDHVRAVKYYVEAIKDNDFPTIKCPNHESAVKKNCGNAYSCARMGAISNPYMAAGNFYVPVHKKSPFGYGLDDQEM